MDNNKQSKQGKSKGFKVKLPNLGQRIKVSQPDVFKKLNTMR